MTRSLPSRCLSFALPLLELCRLGRDVAGDDGRMVPIRPLQAVGEDVLLHLVDAAAVVTLLVRQRCGEEFVGLPAHQHRVARQQQFQGVLLGLVIEVFGRPPMWALEHTIQGHQRGFDDLSHSRPPSSELENPPFRII